MLSFKARPNHKEENRRPVNAGKILDMPNGIKAYPS